MVLRLPSPLRPWLTPEFAVFLLAAALTLGLGVLQARAREASQTLIGDFRQVATLWSDWTVASPDEDRPGPGTVGWTRARGRVDQSLRPVLPLEPRVGALLEGLDHLPAPPVDLKTYARQRSWFDQGERLLEELSQRQADSLAWGLGLGLLLAFLAFALSLRRGRLLQRRAALERRQTLRAERRAAIQDHERWRIARELHDGVAQDLALAKLVLQQMNCSDCLHGPNRAVRQDLGQALDQCLREIRWICGTLREPADTQGSLLLTLERCARDIQARFGLPVEVQAVTGLGGSWSPSTLHEVGRIVGEALTNGARHSGSPTLRLRALEVGPQVRILVEDEGRGWDGTEGFGIHGIRERAELLGASLRWDPLSPGTRMTLILPDAKEVSG